VLHRSSPDQHVADKIGCPLKTFGGEAKLGTTVGSSDDMLRIAVAIGQMAHQFDRAMHLHIVRMASSQESVMGLDNTEFSGFRVRRRSPYLAPGLKRFPVSRMITKTHTQPAA